MKILLINKFLYPKGGAEISTLTTGKLLITKGHKVIFWGMEHASNPEYPYKNYFVSRVDLNKSVNFFRQFKIAARIFYSLEAKIKIEKVIKLEKPDIVHLHNFAHQISPSILNVFKKYNIPVVMTMHDYKLVCPVYSMFSRGKVCEKCKKGKYYWCFFHKCTKNSYLKSLVNTIEMYLHHKILHIYNLIDIFISPSLFLKEKSKDMGFKKEIIYLPNFIKLIDYQPSYHYKEKTLIYFGRLSLEKGLNTLISAVKGLDINIKIIGEGPLGEDLKSRVKSEKINNVSFLGYKLGRELKEEIKSCMAVILPSECYENNPMSIIEAFALGKPVIGSRIGGIPELVKGGTTGFSFEAENVKDLREKIRCLISNTDKITEMGKNARKFVEENFNSEKYYSKLIEIYETAISKYKFFKKDKKIN